MDLLATPELAETPGDIGLGALGWDIRSRLEPEAHFSDESLPVLMDVVIDQLTIFFFNPRPKLPAPVRFRWELTGVGAKNADIIVEGDSVSVSDAGTMRADVTFGCDTETYFLIAKGRLAVDKATAERKLRVQGDDRLVLEFERSFTWS